MVLSRKIWSIAIIVAIIVIIAVICYFNSVEGVGTITKGTLI